MFRNKVEISTTFLHNFVLNHGALGDVITSLPAIIHARRTHHENLKLRVWVPPWQMELIAHLLAPYGTFEVRDFTTFPAKWADRRGSDIGPVSLNQTPFNTTTRNRVCLVDYAFGCLLDARPESMAERNYPTAADLGVKVIEGDYIVFPVGATSDNKLFKASVMAPVMEWALRRGYKPVIVGTKTSHTMAEANGTLRPIVIREETELLPPPLFAQCLDMREKTTLLELRDILGHARAVVGIDGGSLHLAGTTDTNILFASGTTLPKHRYIARHGDPSYKIRYVGSRDLECYACQSRWTLTSLDFSECAYGDSLCMEKLDPTDFIDGLKELGL